MSRLTVIADEHIWAVREALAWLPGYTVNLTVLPAAEIDAAAVRHADVLLTRTGVRVDADLLQGSSVRFAGTATIGDDHYDKAWLDEQGIVWATAAGSSTLSVVEYVLAALFHTLPQQDWHDTVLGIVGVGRIGGVLAQVCRKLGFQVLCNDPPRQRQEGDTGFVSLDEILQQADVMTLHTPLIREGQDSTLHLLHAQVLAQFQGRGIINAARGACVDNQALWHWLEADSRHWAVMDCWESEPVVSPELLAHPGCVLATPHIAGHSLDGKAANTQYIYHALCRFLGVEPVWHMTQSLPPVEALPEQAESWREWSERLYPIARDSRALKHTLQQVQAVRGEAFVHLRRNYPVRRTWAKQSQRAARLFEGVEYDAT